MANYIFGYGSLMNSSSRQLTGQTRHALPVIVQGLVRHWGKIDTTLVASPLVVDIGEGQVNGVLLEINHDELANFDKREHGYHRHKIDPKTINFNTQPLGTSKPNKILKDDDLVWVYIKNKPLPPCEKTPILQTYVDTVLEGCLEVSESFAQFFIDNTIGWQHPIANDRSSPLYINYAGVNQTKLAMIDRLLQPITGNR
ncbi:gamma-glutamylcyclotransferase family protein [Vibrio sp. RC27]